MSRISVIVIAAAAVLLLGMPDLTGVSNAPILVGFGALGWSMAAGAVVRA
jgi:hypothetical protein